MLSTGGVESTMMESVEHAEVVSRPAPSWAVMVAQYCPSAKESVMVESELVPLEV